MATSISARQATAMERVQAVVGPKGWPTDPGELAPPLLEERGLYRGRTAMMVRPASTAEAAAVVAICAEMGTPIVPQGGNTGMMGGATPFEGGHEILLSMSRMNRIRALDPLNYTITVEAGCILANIQKTAEDADRLFPLSLGAEGTCQIGGNLSTNAGGVQVLRYGMARDLVLGLEVVLPDGRVLHSLRGLRTALEETLADAMEAGLAFDATLAASAQQSKAMWRLRDSITEAQKPEGGSIKHDVSVPVSSVADFIAEATAVCARAIPGSRPVAFGHVGDGNIHFNLSQPANEPRQGAPRDAFIARWGEVNRLVHDIVKRMNGSISAEHGIGRRKMDELVHYKSAVEIELMRTLKRALHPKNIMNPGKVVVP